MEKRNIQISLKEAKEWYNSDNSFKRELAVKAYSETELSKANYSNIIRFLKDEVMQDNINRAEVYGKLLDIAKYYNSIYPEEYNPLLGKQQYYIITKETISALFMKYKDFSINRSVCKSEYEIAFNSPKAAKKAIDILGDELNILFE